MSFTELITDIRDKGNDGKAFELFCKWFLQNDSIWKTQVKKVWLWDDWPENWGRDKGIDLIFEHRNGQIWAIQAKCYDSVYNITKEDVDKFLSESNRPAIHKRLLIGTTNGLGANAIEVMEGQEKPVKRYLLDDFENSAVNYPKSISDLSQPAKIIAPDRDRKYQQNAVSEVIKKFKVHDRGQLIMACGTGKTFVTLWIKEKMAAETTLVLLPSLGLLSQTLFEWTKNSSRPFEVLCVCSDKTVGKEEREEDINITDAAFDVTSDVTEIASFFKTTGEKVIFCTYQSSELIGEAQGKNVIDLVVCDEAHRCAGAASAKFTKVLNDDFIRSKKRLFTTATPRLFSDRVTKAAERAGDVIYGMDDEQIFGPEFFNYSFAEAIEQKWLTDYQVLVIAVDEPLVQKYVETRELIKINDAYQIDAASLAAKIALIKATNEYDLKRVISFHNRVKAAKDFSAKFFEVLTCTKTDKKPPGKIYTDYVSGDMSSRQRRNKLKIMKDLSISDRVFISNAKCLSEGVDVPSLDGVAFIEPKGSQIDIIQALGRVLRLHLSKEKGTILLPVFISSEESVEASIEASNFKPIWDVVKALRSHDKAFAEQLDKYRNAMGRTGRRKQKGFPDKIIFDIPTSLNTQFTEAVQCLLVEKTTSSWEFYIGLLEKFFDREGHCLVPKLHLEEAYRLGAWVDRQRTRKQRLSPTQLLRLEDIKFVWDVPEHQWEEGFLALKKFFAREGHCLVPAIYEEDNIKLGSWVNSQRTKKSELDIKCVQQLNDIGFIWKANDYQWEKGFLAFKKFVSREGHCVISRNHQEGDIKLGIWVSNQKVRKGRLTPEQIQRLDNLGFVWWNVR